MARSGSPTRFNGYENDSIVQNLTFTQDINEQMRVPKRIRATGEYFDEHDILNSNGGGIGNGMGNSSSMNSWSYPNKIDMTVPDRIVVLGQDQHLGTRSAPREILLDNTILPTNPGLVRVSTPPRIISLAQHHFPSATDEPTRSPSDGGAGDFDEQLSLDSSEVQQPIAIKNRRVPRNFPSELVVSQRENTPPLGPISDNLTPNEEISHLRRQLIKLNRRVLTIEIDAGQRQQREKVVYCIGLAYFLLKAFMWLNRN